VLLEPLPDQPAIEAGGREEELQRIRSRALALERELNAVRARMRQIEAGYRDSGDQEG
jgi:hypothetical protein